MTRFTWLPAISLALPAAALMVMGAQIGWADEITGTEVVLDEPAPTPPPAPADDEDPISFYFTALAGGSIVEGQSGGYNTWGFFENSGNDYDEQVFGGGAVGVAYDVGPIVLRVDIEGEAGRGEHSLETNSFPGAPDPAVHYQTDIEIPWTVLGNVWIDFPLRYHWPDCAIVNRLTPFIGAGFGASEIELSTNDAVVRGGEEETDFSWQIGGGLAFEVADFLTLETRYRLLEIGEVDADLEHMGLGIPAGNYDLNLRAHEVLAGIRFTF